MFVDNFSFDASPRSPSLDSSNASSTGSSSPNISPCTTPSSAHYSFSQYSVADLAATFANQRIRNESQIRYDSCDAYAADDDDAGWSLDPVPACHSTFVVSGSRQRAGQPPRPHSPSQRAQRQAGARMLCSASHHKDIAALVARMVESNDQCFVSSPDSFLQNSSRAFVASEDDEGYDSSDAMTIPSQTQHSGLICPRSRLEYRRSSDMKITSACVNKAVRLRKPAKHRRLHSAENESC